MEVLGALDCKVEGIATLNCLPNMLPILITWAITFAFIVALVLVIYSGFKFITSGGDEKQVEGAKHTLTYAIIGLIVVLASFFIVQFIGKTTGVVCINTFGFSSCGGPPGSGFSCSGPKPSGCPKKAYCDNSTNTWKCPPGR